MSIELSEHARKVIQQLVAQGKYASAEDAVNAIIKRSVPRSMFDERSEEEIVASQKQAMKELLEEIKDMPVDPDAPEFSGRDHDRILYGGSH
jgi:Arc/MetJ-type ribon-helix-helix transcriptional regulator